MRTPWFQIIDVVEPRGRSIADIAAECAEEFGVNLNVLRSPLMFDHIVDARHKTLARIRQERPDLRSHQVAAYFHRESSTIRHSWRKTQGRAA